MRWSLGTSMTGGRVGGGEQKSRFLGGARGGCDAMALGDAAGGPRGREYISVRRQQERAGRPTVSRPTEGAPRVTKANTNRNRRKREEVAVSRAHLHGRRRTRNTTPNPSPVLSRLS